MTPRQPVVQALGLLRHEGLVVERGRRGLAVAAFEPTRVRDLYEVRGALDGLAARLAAESAAFEAKDALEPLLKTGNEALARGDVSALITADVAFHRTIYDLSGNPEIGAAAETLWPHFRRAMSAVVRMRGQDARLRARTWREHREIAAAIGGGKADQAERLAVSHCHAAGETTADHLENVETIKKMNEPAGRTRQCRSTPSMPKTAFTTNTPHPPTKEHRPSYSSTR